MMQLKKAQMHKVFHKLDVKLLPCKHHIRGVLKIPNDDGGENVALIPIYFSHGRGDIPKPVAKKIQKALLLDDSKFAELTRCHMKKEEYFIFLKEELDREFS